MVECPTCGEPLEDSTVVCSICAKEIHRNCANKKSGKWYCSNCKKEAKQRSRYEEMAQRDRSFGR